MGKVSTLIGTVIDGIPQLNREIDGEKFYTIDVSFRGTNIPVLYSEYVDITELSPDTKVKVVGCLMSDVKRNELPVFYFYANSIEIADIDSETTNLVNFSCTVTKIREFKATDKCIELLPLVAADGSPLSTTSVLYFCAKQRIARRLKGKEAGYTITGTGYLKAYKDVYEINIKSLENFSDL